MPAERVSTTAEVATIIRGMRSAADASGSWSENRRQMNRKGLGTAVLVFFAVVIVVGAIAFSAAESLLAWDVRFAYLPAAEAVLDGQSPYPALDDPILEDQKGYVYPPQLVLLLVPFTWLPVAAVALLATLVLVALLGLTLWILEIRDVRCYAAALLWVPTISGLLLGNVSIPLAFALAVLWRYRDRVWPSGAALGLSVSAKLVLWPMFIWMLATRRLRASALAVAIGVVVTLGAWALDRVRRAHGVSRSRPEVVRHPGREQLLAGRHGSDGGTSFRRGAGAHGSRGRRAARGLRRLRASR